MSNQFGILLLLGFAWHVRTTLSQLSPPISCPEYFEYINQEDLYSGKITLRDLPFDTINLQVKFSQRVPIESNFRGRLSFEHDLLMTQKKMENGEPITYLVEFPLSYVLPKLIRMVVNGMEVCSAPDYPDPRTTFGLQRSFTPAAGTHRRQNEHNTTNTNDAARSIASEGNLKEAPDHTKTEQSASQDYESICGREVDGSIIKLRHGRVPWLAQIYKVEAGNQKYMCSGSLVSSRTIVSAAHCVAEIRSTADADMLAVLGQLGISGIMTHKISRMFQYPHYRGYEDTGADISLINLESPVTFSANIRPICLWTGNNDIVRIENTEGSAASWQRPEKGPNIFSAPEIVNMTVISFKDCLYSNSFFTKILSVNAFCAGNQNGTGICKGDSGIGLAFDIHGRWTLRGVVSTALVTETEKCFTADNIVFSDASKYTDWVLANMPAESSAASFNVSNF